jgi:hypothetical protein
MPSADEHVAGIRARGEERDSHGCARPAPPGPTLFLTGARLVCSLESSPCRRTRRYRRMPSAQESGQCPSWRFYTPQTNRMSLLGVGVKKRCLIYDERSWNVYENKQTIDTMTD